MKFLRADLGLLVVVMMVFDFNFSWKLSFVKTLLVSSIDWSHATDCSLVSSLLCSLG